MESDRDNSIEQQYRTALLWVDQCQEGKKCDQLAQFIVVDTYSHGFDPKIVTARLGLSQKILKSSISTNVKHWGGYRIREIALFHILQDCQMKFDHSCSLTYGKELMKLYPSSIQYSGVKRQVDQALKELDK